jgi:hypothetical protein
MCARGDLALREHFEGGAGPRSWQLGKGLGDVESGILER